MDKMVMVKDLKQGDIIQGTDKNKIEIISNNNGLLFYYIQSTGEFKEKRFDKNDYVWRF